MASLSFFGSILFFLLASFAYSTILSSNQISGNQDADDKFETRVLPGRTLLQQKASCGIDFENQNYTIITSQCKGPNYHAKTCCGALKELACPFSEELNDMKNDCAITLFSYINLYGKYPPGLFANLCHEDKEGLNCDQVMEAKAKQQQSSRAAETSTHFSMLMIFAVSYISLLCI